MLNNRYLSKKQNTLHQIIKIRKTWKKGKPIECDGKGKKDRDIEHKIRRKVSNDKEISSKFIQTQSRSSKLWYY